MLEDCEEISIVGQAGSAMEALELIQQKNPDVVVLDLIRFALENAIIG